LSDFHSDCLSPVVFWINPNQDECRIFSTGIFALNYERIFIRFVLMAKANRKVPIKYVIVGLQGDIIEEAWA